MINRHYECQNKYKKTIFKNRKVNGKFIELNDV